MTAAFLNRPVKFIGIGHYARVGKDTLANAIIEECRRLDPYFTIVKRPWALKLKDVCHQLYSWAGLRELEYYETEPGASQREVVLPAIGKSPRQIWIDFGTTAIRDHVYEKTWLDYNLHTDHEADAVIVPDTRFFNEVSGISSIGGHTVKVVRPGYGPGKNTPDRELVRYAGWQNVWLNKGTLDDAHEMAWQYANWLVGGGPEPICTNEEMFERLSHEVIEPWEESEAKASIAESLWDKVVHHSIIEEAIDLECTNPEVVYRLLKNSIRMCVAFSEPEGTRFVPLRKAITEIQAAMTNNLPGYYEVTA